MMLRAHPQKVRFMNEALTIAPYYLLSLRYTKDTREMASQFTDLSTHCEKCTLTFDRGLGSL